VDEVQPLLKISQSFDQQLLNNPVKSGNRQTDRQTDRRTQMQTKRPWRRYGTWSSADADKPGDAFRGQSEVRFPISVL